MCPKCAEAMVVVEFQGIELDHCVRCRGVWLDAGELELICGQAGVAAGRLESVLDVPVSPAPTDRPCPRCPRKLQAVTLATAPPVEVDRCPSGHGIWLDGGELGTIVKALTRPEDAVVARVLGGLFRHDAAHTEEH